MADEKKVTNFYFDDIEMNGETLPAIILHTPGIIDLQSPNVRIPTPIKIKWNDSTNSYTKTITFDGKEIVQTFTLTVVGKGTANEEVTALTLPDGSKINFEGFKV